MAIESEIKISLCFTARLSAYFKNNETRLENLDRFHSNPSMLVKILAFLSNNQFHTELLVYPNCKITSKFLFLESKIQFKSYINCPIVPNLNSGSKQ